MISTISLTNNTRLARNRHAAALQVISLLHMSHCLKFQACLNKHSHLHVIESCHILENKLLAPRPGSTASPRPKGATAETTCEPPVAVSLIVG